MVALTASHLCPYSAKAVKELYKHRHQPRFHQAKLAYPSSTCNIIL